MKRVGLSFFLALLISILPLGSLARAYDEVVTINLDNYHGDALDLADGNRYVVLLSGDNVIDTTGEYGIRANASELFFRGSDPDIAASLTVNVHSSTTTANGIINTGGSIYFEQALNVYLNIDSALTQSEISTSNVTGITTPETGSVSSTNRTLISIYNPTGNLGIYTGSFYSAHFLNVTPLGYRTIVEVTHKITDGYGDAFLYNDIEGNDVSLDFKVNVAQPEMTFLHLRGDTLGLFRLLPAAPGYSANYDTVLTAGEDFATAEAKIVGSIAKELHPEDHANTTCYRDDGVCPYVPEFFEIDKTKSGLVVTSPALRGAPTTISADQSYALKITFRITDPEHYAFSKLEGYHPYNTGILNGVEGYYFPGIGARTYVSGEEIYVLVPLTVATPLTISEPQPIITTPEPATDPEPEPEPELESEPEPEPEVKEPAPEEPTPEPEIEEPEIEEPRLVIINNIVIPKTPNTGYRPQTNPML